MSVTERLIDHALGVDWTRLPPATQQAARTFLHDTICVGVAGAAATNAGTILRVAQQWGSAGSCLVLGRPGVRLSAPYAAFVNAFQIHAQEYDCVHETAVAHPMATVVAALIAETDRSGPYSGASFLAALVAGVDVVATLGVAATTPLKFFRPATAGIFGSVAAVARLRNLERAVARDAFGYALAFASGTMQAHVEGKPALAVQVGAAARSAIEAVDLAVAGLAGPQASIEGPFGYFALFEDGVEAAAALAALGKQWRIDELSWKPFPTGRAAHGAIVAQQQLMTAHGIDAASLDQFTYRAPPLIYRLVGRRPFIGMDAAYARLCFAYLGAVTLVSGTVALTDFSPKALADPRILELAERFTVVSDGNPDPAAFVPATATVTVRGGGQFAESVALQFGSPAWPLSRSEHLVKARSCLEFGGLGGAAASLAAIVGDFDTAPDAALALGAAFGAIGASA